MSEPRVRVLFVCLGNICRSPSAEAVFTDLLVEQGLHQKIVVDSAGTGNWHVGQRADPRARQVGDRRGYNVTSLARQVSSNDFEQFDIVIAMDRSNVAGLRHLAPSAEHAQRIRLLRDFDDDAGSADVPDPYYGDASDFEEMFSIIEDACEGLLDHIRDAYGL